MAEALIQSVQDMLKEETWTRATISNYTQNNLKDLSQIVKQARAEGCVDEVLAICEEHLSHTKESIIALYLAGILSLFKGSIDNSHLETLVDFFQKNHKEPIVTYLCEYILAEDPINKFALRTLAEIYASEGNDKVWDLYVTIVKVDFEEAELAKTLAEHFESIGDEEKSVEYYKKAILRYINNDNYIACKDIWTKLVQKIPTEIDFFHLLRRKISKKFGDLKTTTLMQELYNWYKDHATIENGYWDTAIMILKENLEVEPKDTWARKEITDCYRGKYAKHSQLEDYIRSSNLSGNSSYRNVFEAINDFEKHIAFDKNSYVFHRSYGVGKIKSLDKEMLTINFGPKIGVKEMTLKMAVIALKPLSKDHFWVTKATAKNLDELKNYVKDKDKDKDREKKVNVLKQIILSFDNNCDFKRIKNELVPGILTPSEWTSWNSAAKKILETDANFGINPNDINMYTVRKQKITAEEKLSNEFKAQKQFFARIDILMTFFNSEETDKTNDLFTEMYSYFTGFLKSIPKVNENVIASYLVVRSISSIDKSFAFPIKETFADLYNRLPNPKETYSLLKDTKNTTLKKDFLRCVKMLPNWNEQYIKLFPIVLDRSLIDDLVNEGCTEDVQKLVRTSFENFKDYRETAMFFFKECQDEDWFKEAGVSYEKQLITLINIIELNWREINNHVNSTENKKLIKNATGLLFDDNALINYMFEHDEDTVKKLYTLIDDIPEFDSTEKGKVRNKILETYPDFKFRVSEEKTAQLKGLIVTSKKLEEKKARLDYLQKEEIPKNNNDIQEAKEKGDLKENQEYKSAKEKAHILNLELSKLQEELNKAIVFDPSTCTTARVSFGTDITIVNTDTNEEKTISLLGPWESDPDNNILSYLTPLGKAAMDKKVGDTITYTVDSNKFSYVIKAIAKTVF